jgi:hypothetical protein
MNFYLIASALILIVTGLAHSFLGERLVLGPLSRSSELPKLLGSSDFMRRTLRFTWHVTTVLLVAVAGVLLILAYPSAFASLEGIPRSIALACLACALISGLATRGRHFSWFLFLAAAVTAWLGAGQ